MAKSPAGPAFLAGGSLNPLQPLDTEAWRTVEQGGHSRTVRSGTAGKGGPRFALYRYRGLECFEFSCCFVAHSLRQNRPVQWTELNRPIVHPKNGNTIGASHVVWDERQFNVPSIGLIEKRQKTAPTMGEGQLLSAFLWSAISLGS